MSFLNPSQRRCWNTCTACLKCEDRGRYAKCTKCSGIHDTAGRIYPDPDVFCDCRNGVLRHRTQKGRLIVTRYPGNPYTRTVTTDAETQDERDWNNWIEETREKLNDPTFDPVRFEDGTSTYDWTKRQRDGRS